MRSEGSPHESRRRTAPDLRALFVLNAVLLVLLAAATFSPAVGAQGRGRGDYMMVAGGLNNSLSSAVYIVDGVNQELIVVNYDLNSKRLQGIGSRNLAGDAAMFGRAQSRPGG